MRAHVSIRLRQDVLVAVRSESVRQGRSVSQVIERALLHYLPGGAPRRPVDRGVGGYDPDKAEPVGDGTWRQRREVTPDWKGRG